MAWAALAGGAVSGIGQGISTYANMMFQEQMMGKYWNFRNDHDYTMQLNNFNYMTKLNDQQNQFKKDFLDYQMQLNSMNTPSALMASRTSPITSSVPNPPENKPFTSTLNSYGNTFVSGGFLADKNKTISSDSGPRLRNGNVTIGRSTQFPAGANVGTQLSGSLENIQDPENWSLNSQITLNSGISDNFENDSNSISSFGTTSTNNSTNEATNYSVNKNPLSKKTSDYLLTHDNVSTSSSAPSENNDTLKN